MKTLTTLIAVVATSFAINVNADSVHNDPGIGDVFPIQDISYQESVNSVSNPNEMVWNSDSEGYILNSIYESSVAGALRELESNPPAAGKAGDNSTFPAYLWNETLEN